jgi:hypothetical protein
MWAVSASRHILVRSKRFGHKSKQQPHELPHESFEVGKKVMSQAAMGAVLQSEHARW